MSLYRLDCAELHRRVDAQRRTRHLSWRELGRHLDLAPSTFSRLGDGKAPDSHGLLTLLVWLDLDTDVAYLIRPTAKENP